MKYSNVTVELQDFYDTKTEIKLNGIYFKYKKEILFITLGHNLPIKKFLYIEDEYFDIDIISKWNELLIVKLKNKTDKYIFKNMRKRDINNITQFYFGDKCHEIKYIKDEYFELNMIPENPRLLYYKFKSKKELFKKGDCGKPIFDNQDKLVGILAKSEDKYGYVIPWIYILRTIEKDNNIYTNDLNVLKVGNYKVINNKIYYPKLDKYIFLDAYYLIEGNQKISCKMLYKNNKSIFKMYKILKNKINDNNINIKNNIVIINSALLLYLHETNLGLLGEILSSDLNRKRYYEHTINLKEIIFRAIV